MYLRHKHSSHSTFASFFQKSIMTMIVCRVLAIDLRGHGDTQTTDEENLGADNLAQ